MSYWSFKHQVSEDSDVLHYGRLGMKWSQHIFGIEHVRTKANKKLVKLDKKVSKAESKTEPKMEKAFIRQTKAQRAIEDIANTNVSINAILSTSDRYKTKFNL